MKPSSMNTTIILCLALLATTGAWAGGLSALPESEGIACDETRNEHTVILLHGMGRGRASLWVLDTRLQRAGYTTLNFPYVTHSHSIDELAQQLIAFIEENVSTSSYHLIAHSLGNLVVRSGVKFGYPPGLGRIVMLAPPNHPAELARVMRDNPIYKWFTGESGQQLASDAFYEQLPTPKTEFGVIAGTRGQAVLLDEPNDGVITVASTRLEGMADWIATPHAHTFIMNSRDVAELCTTFIETGRFVLPEAPAESAEAAPADAGMSSETNDEGVVRADKQQGAVE